MQLHIYISYSYVDVITCTCIFSYVYVITYTYYKFNAGLTNIIQGIPDSKVHVANMWPIWGLPAQEGSMLAPSILLSGIPYGQ